MIIIIYILNIIPININHSIHISTINIYDALDFFFFNPNNSLSSQTLPMSFKVYILPLKRTFCVPHLESFLIKSKKN